jgi:hypothetical protein
MKKAIDFFDANDLIHAAFRYYLGRRTISANAFAQHLAKSWLHIHENTRMMIGNELLQAYEDAEKHPDWKPLGDQCDIEAWDLVKAKIQINENNKSGRTT